MVVGIIGAGASGMAAALAAAENPQVQVVLLERQSRVGRKLQATGNGRCNLTNLQASQQQYHGEDPAFVSEALRKMDPAATVQWFAGLGLYCIAEPSGKVYPYSDQANSVVDILRLNLQKENITVRLGFDVQKVKREEGRFIIEGDGESVFCHKLIVACGGLAGTKLGGSMSGYKLLQKLGHKATRLRPSLVQLKTDWNGVVGLKGVRTNCHVQILRDRILFAESVGELQFTDYGLSGPVIFEVSRDVCYGPGQWTAVLDFLPDWNDAQLCEELMRRWETELPVEDILTGILHNRLGRVLAKASGIQNARQVKELQIYQLDDLCKSIKRFELNLTEPMGMDCAQVTAGGILTQDFDPETMESRLIPGLYACGEVLDIDGDCGGYNLQWAWSSGRCAGLHAGKEAE